MIPQNDSPTGLGGKKIMMKKTILLIGLVFLLAGCGKTVQDDTIQIREHLAYLPNEPIPFSGNAVSHYANGQRKTEVTYKAGKHDGLERVWYENGQLAIESTFKDGKQHGLTRRWRKDGRLRSEATYKDGRLQR